MQLDAVGSQLPLNAFQQLGSAHTVQSLDVIVPVWLDCAFRKNNPTNHVGDTYVLDSVLVEHAPTFPSTSRFSYKHTTHSSHYYFYSSCSQASNTLSTLTTTTPPTLPSNQTTLHPSTQPLISSTHPHHNNAFPLHQELGRQAHGRRRHRRSPRRPPQPHALQPGTLQLLPLNCTRPFEIEDDETRSWQ